MLTQVRTFLVGSEILNSWDPSVLWNHCVTARVGFKNLNYANTVFATQSPEAPNTTAPAATVMAAVSLPFDFLVETQ